MKKVGRKSLTVPRLEPRELESFRSFVRGKSTQLSDARKDARQQLQLLTELDGELSAKQAILIYLRLFVSTPVTTQELEIVSGISEYARRIRELVSEGHTILTANAGGEITYTLQGE